MKKKFLIWIIAILLLSSFASAQTLVLEYNCDENVLDQVNSNDGTAGGAMYYDSRVPSYNTTGDGGTHSCGFVGSATSRIEAPNTNELDFSTDDYSIAVRFFTNTSSVDYGVIFANGDELGGNPATIFDIGTSNAYRAMIRQSSTAKFATGGSISRNVWHLGIISKEGDYIKFYIDTIEIASTSGVNSFNLDNSNPLTLGVKYSSGTPTIYTYEGLIDDFQVYKGDYLDATQRANLFNYGDIDGAAPSTDYFEITAQDIYNSSLNNFSVTITDNEAYSGVPTTLSTTNGTITTNIEDDSGYVLNNLVINATNHFLTYDTNVVVSSDYEFTDLIQTITSFEAYEKFSFNQVNNFSVNDGSLYDSTINGTAILNLKSGDYQNVTFNNSIGYFNIVDSFNITALQNETYNFSVYNSVLNITAINAYTLANISTFEGYILNIDTGLNETFSSTNNLSQVNVIFGNYSVYLEADDYALSNSTNYQVITINDSYEALSFGLYTNNSILVYIRDEDTGSLIDDTNISIVLSSNSTENTYYTATGSYFFENLTDGTYSLKLSGGNYTLKTYNVVVAERSTQVLNAYLSLSTEEVIFTIVEDETGAFIETAPFSVSRIVNGTWSVIQSKYSDITGRVQFTYTPNVKYQFYVSPSGYEPKTFELDPIIFSSYTIRLDRIQSINKSMDFSDVSVWFEPKYFYDDMQNNLTIYFNSPDGVFSNYGFKIVYPGGNNFSSGNNANGENFEVKFNISGATIQDRVNITIYYTSSIDGKLKSFNYYYGIIDSASLFGTALSNADSNLPLFDRVFIMVFAVLILSGIAFTFGGEIASALAAMGLMGYFAAIRFVDSWITIISIIILFIIIAWRSDR